MHAVANGNKYLPFQVLILAAVMVFTLFAWQGNKGFNLADEGFLWYGVQRVMLGEVPLRDFMAYEPGRYYWSAGLMSLWGDNGIMALRAAVAIFQTLGLFVGLFLIAGAAESLNKQNIFYLLLSAVTLLVWMYPRHKLFDISLSILLIGTLTFLVQHPSIRRYFLAGLCVGMVAIFGRNHGMYGVMGSLGVLAWVNYKRIEGPGLVKGFGFWALGVTAGYSPILIMTLLVPGYASAVLENLRFLFERGATNISLFVPWPWRVNFDLPIDEVVRGIFIGMFFIGIIAFGVLSILWVIWQKNQCKKVAPVLVASSFLALPYAHYAYSRADIGHLAQGMFPFLVGCLVLLSSQPAKIKWPSVIILFVASVSVMHTYHPGWRCFTSKQCVSVEISGRNLKVDPGTASNIALLHSLVDQYAPDGQSFVVTPFWPGAYALFERKSPMWAVYALWHRSDELQRREIERIRKSDPSFVLISDHSLDGRDDLKFMNTNKLIYQYVVNNYHLLSDSLKGQNIYRKTGGSEL